MKANNALIILWSGDKISDYQVGKIMEQLVLSGIAEQQNITVVYKDEDSIANALLREATVTGVVVTDQKEPSVTEAIKNAVIYIGKRFEVSLASTNADLTSFTIELVRAVNAAKATGYEPELLNAIEILSTSTGKIPGKLVEQYHFTKQAIAIIKKVYKRMH
jgi:uncharacterized protein (DUF111 family)